MVGLYMPVELFASFDHGKVRVEDRWMSDLKLFSHGMLDGINS